MNIVLFVAFVILGYEAGHKNPSEYEKAKKAFDEAKKRLDEEAGDVKKAAEKLADSKIEFNKAHSERENTFERIKYRAEEEKDIWVGLVKLYRSSNMKAREIKTKPRSFYTDPERLISIPEPLQKINCDDCCYMEE
ncbi:MAG: hypothetical protein ACUVUQ_10025 [Thermodesulfovibrionales bacterium]